MIKNIFTSIVIVLLLACIGYSQQINTISSRCPSPNQREYSSVRANVVGNITYIPCPSGSNIFSGNVDFSGATLTGVVSGSGTANFIPRFTAASVIGNTPFSWNGTVYDFKNTALTNTYLFQFTPALGTSTFSVGDAGDFLHLFEGTTTDTWQKASGSISLLAGDNITVTPGLTLTLSGGNGGNSITLPASNSVNIAGGNATLDLASTAVSAASGLSSFIQDGGTNVTTITAPNGVTVDAGSSSLVLGGAGTKLRISNAQTPASAAAACTTGQIAWDTSFIYVCVNTNTWKRVAIATW